MTPYFSEFFGGVETLAIYNFPQNFIGKVEIEEAYMLQPWNREL